MPVFTTPIKRSPHVITNQPTGFANQYNAFSSMLDEIKNAYAKGTTAAGSAYAKQHGKASDLAKQIVNGMPPAQVDFFSGLNFTDPNDLTKKQTDITNSTLAAWDKAAAKFMHGQFNDGESARLNMQKRLQEFDDVIANSGNPAVTPDT